jgi:hypothetical protein
MRSSLVFFEYCCLVSTVIPVSYMVFYILNHIFSMRFSMHVACQSIRWFSKVFSTLHVNHMFVQFVFTSSCILCICAYLCVLLFAWRLAGFMFIRISVYALEQIMYVKCILWLLFWIILVILLNWLSRIFLYFCILTVTTRVDISTWLSAHCQVQNNKHNLDKSSVLQ